jgi:hypothetical protein
VQKEAAFTMADAVRDKLRGPAKTGEIKTGEMEP